MEHTDWMNTGLDSPGARFLMLTAITQAAIEGDPC